MRPHGVADWFDCLQYECQLAGIPVPPRARAAYDDCEELIRGFVLSLGQRRLSNVLDTEEERKQWRGW